jgi:hypothetical protein
MKKIALFVSVLLLATALFADAPVFEAKPGISGNATFTFGADLDNQVTGFANATASNLTLALIGATTDEKGGKDGEEVYGWIKLDGMEMKVDADDKASDNENTAANLTIETPEISAKLFLGPVYVNILGADVEIDKASSLIKAVLTNVLTQSQDQADEFQGLAIGLKDTSVVDLVVGVSSRYDWLRSATATTFKWKAPTSLTQTTPEAEVDTASVADQGGTNFYNFYLGVGLKAVENLTAELAANMTTQENSTVGFGAKVGYGIALAEGFKLNPTVGFDGSLSLASGNAFSGQITVDIPLAVPGKGLDDDDTFNADIDYAAGLDLRYTVNLSGKMDAGVYFYDADLLPVVNLLVAYELVDITSVFQTGFGAKLSADLGVIDPWLVYKMANGTSSIKLEVGVDITAITNTTFTLKYASGELAGGSPKAGIITFATKIAY